MSKISENLEKWYAIDLENGSIGELINFFVPEDYLGYFAKMSEPYTPDFHWWNWKITRSEKDSVGSHVHGLLTNLDHLLVWMPDISPEELDKMWETAGNQCLTWVYG